MTAAKLSFVGPLGILLGLLLLYTGTDGQSEGYYRPDPRFDCAKTCSVAAGACDEEDIANSPCRCDEKCVIYGDCCSNAPICNETAADRDAANRLDGLLQCRSIHLNSSIKPDWRESFWMVSSCPTDWLAGRDDQISLYILNDCTRGSNSLPPVTDLNSGIVYKNEYCAVCHGVEMFQSWGYRFECSPLLQKVFDSGMEITTEIVEQYCIACGFNAVQASSARACFHDSLVDDTCLEREELQNRTGNPIDEEEYQELVMQCQNAPISPVEPIGVPIPIPYRNQYCAICNGINLATEFVGCFNPYEYRDKTNHCRERAAKLMPPTPSPMTPSTPPSPIPLNKTQNGTDFIPLFRPSPEVDFDAGPTQPSPFVIILDVNGDSQIIHSETVFINITTSCPAGKVFDPVNRNCRTTICPESTRGEACAIGLCEGALLSLEEDEFELLPDNTTLQFRGEIYNIIGYVNNSLPSICTNFTQNGTHEINMTVTTYSYPSYPAAFSILTYIGCSLSLVGCVFVLFTYSIFKELQTLPGRILMNLAAAILGTCVFLLIGIPLLALAGLCQTTAILLHWLVLSQFSWMTIMSFELARSLFRATRLQKVQAPKVKNQIFLIYMLIGWGLPTIITGVSIVINYTTDYIEYGEDRLCWIGHVASFYIVFLAPVALSILLNGITFSITAYLLFKASRGQAKLEKKKNTSYVRIYLSVFSITGLTWIFGFVAILAQGDWAWYLFIILTSTQGFAICAAFLFTKKIATLYKQFFWPKVHKSFSFRSSSKNGIQTTSVAIHYAKKGEKVNTVSSQGNSSEIQEAVERGEPTPVHYTKKEFKD